MADEGTREPACDPQDLERLLVSRERVGDVDGMLALYESHAVLDDGAGRLMIGREAIRAFFVELVATGPKFDFGDQRPALVSGDLALTSTRGPDGSVTAEVARRQSDGTWLWVIDQFSIVEGAVGLMVHSPGGRLR
jgi:hypothetical protein